MKFIMTVILLYACLSINAQQSTTEMKKIIDAMQDMYHVNFVYDSSWQILNRKVLLCQVVR